MPTDQEYEALIAGMDRPALATLWPQILNRQAPPPWEPGKAFEYLIVRLFELDGAVVRWPFNVSIGPGRRITEQIDGAIYLPGLTCILEAKNEAGAIDVEPIAKVRHQLERRPSGLFALVFSTSGFTLPALELHERSGNTNILLWESVDVAHALGADGRMADGLMTKYRAAVESGFLNFRIAPPLLAP